MNNNYKIPYSKVSIEEDEINAVIDCLKSGWLTTGEKTFNFEKKFSEYVNSSYALAVSSCTAAIHLSLLALGIQKNNEVILSSMTFVSVANVIEYCGAIPVFVDIDPHTFNMTAENIEKAINKNTKAIIVVHYAGHPCDMDEINSIASRYDIPVIEDAAHAIGTEYREKIIGDSNNLVCFSFYPTKTITTVEGGMITTNNDIYIEKIKKMRLHGMSHSAWERYGNSKKWYYDVDCVGFKYNMPDLLAAIGLEQLKKLERFIGKRQNIAKNYDLFLKENSAFFRIQTLKENIRHSRFMYPISLYNINQRAQFIDYLQSNGIQVSVLFTPIYHFKYYQNKYRLNEKEFPICEKFAAGLVCLPIYPLLTGNEVEFINTIIKNFISKDIQNEY